MKCISKICFNIFKNYQSIKLLKNDDWTRIYLTPELCKKKKKEYNNVLSIIIICLFFLLNSKK